VGVEDSCELALDRVREPCQRARTSRKVPNSRPLKVALPV
jgi:hypothetical protein